MTDPNVPPPRDPDPRPEVVHHTTINNPGPDRSGTGWIGFLVGGIVVVLIIIAVVMFAGGGLNSARDTKVDVDVDLPRPELPEAPKLPEVPDLPPVEPPSVPNPDPAPANQG
jgi:hypothetical protein